MYLERSLRLVAGALILISLILWEVHSRYWMALTVAVAFSLFQSGFTNWCPMMTILKALGIKEKET